MKKRSIEQLSRRERQIMNIIYREAEATVAVVRDSLPDPPSYSAVRALLRILVSKGYLKHRQHGRAYVYSPTVNRDQVRRMALRQLVRDFYDGSIEHVVATLISPSAGKISPGGLDRLEELIRDRRRRRKK